MRDTSLELQLLNQKIAGLKPSATLRINEQSAQMIAEGKNVYRLGFGQSPFPVPTEVAQSLQTNAHQKDYLPVKGLYDLRKSVARFNTKKLGISCTADNVMIGPGSKELIYLAQLSLNGVLLLPSPSWVSYEPQAHLVNKAVHWIHTTEINGWKLQASELEAACLNYPSTPKLLILNYPNNPVGNSYTPQELEQISHIAKKYNLVVISDEIYGEVTHSGHHISLAQYYAQGTIISNGLSKWCGAGGWRLGTFTFPNEYKWLLDAMAIAASETFSAVAAPIQYAAITAFEGSEAIDEYINKSRLILKTIAQYTYDSLSASHISMPKPQGGFYLFPNFGYYRSFFNNKQIYTSTKLCEQLLTDTGVALLPGVAFGRPPEELTARLAYVDFDGNLLLNLPTLNRATILDHSPNITKAIMKIKNWITS